MLSVLLVVSWFLGGEVAVFDSTIQPFDLVADQGAYPLTGVHQLESDGRHVYLRSFREQGILQIQKDGRLVRMIGRPGEGPGEWGSSGVLMIALDGSRVWGIGTSQARMVGFQRGALVADFRMDEVTAGHYGATSNVFAAAADQLVVPSPLRATHLAEVYGSDGQHLGPLGEVIVTDPVALKQNPFLNDTMWVFHREHWYAVFKFFPTLVVYDRNFQKRHHFNLEDTWIAETIGLLSVDGMTHTMRPLFSDFKMYGNNVYLMCRGRLLQIDASTGQILSRTRFHGKSEVFAGPTDKPLTLPFFCFLEGGTLIMGHPMLLWDHDLWSANLPFLSENSRP